MDRESLKLLLEQIQSGRMSINDGMDTLKTLPFKNLGHTRLDTHRSLRKNMPEVVFCEHKEASQILDIMKESIEHSGRVLGTRASKEQAEFVIEHIPNTVYDPRSKILK